VPSNINEWPLKPLSEVVDLNPRLDKSAFRDNLEISFVPMAAVEAGSGHIDVSQTKYFSKVKKGYTPFQENDVLFAKITPCMENGKRAVVPKLTNGLGFGSTEFHVLRPHEGINPRYVYHFVSSQNFRRDAAHRMTGAVGQKRVPQSFLEKALIPVPLYEEQKLIVAEIEKQFSRLDEAIASLKRIKANLKRYKAAVLKAAVEGKLTEEWRKQHPDIEPASKLLERILAERRKKWNGKGKYKEPQVSSTAGLPPLPKAWTYASVEQLGIIGEQAVLTGPFGTNLGREDFEETGIPVLTISCLKDSGIDLSKAEHVSKGKAVELERYRLRDGDLLFSRMAAVGRAGIVTGNLRGSLINYHIMRLRLEPTVLMAQYYLTYVRGSSQVENYIREVNHGATRDGINTIQLLNMPVALPPIAEQKEIVAEVERRLSVIDELEATVEANLTRADTLHQSVLKKAFAGELK